MKQKKNIQAHPKFNLGFNWILKSRFDFKYNTTIAIRSDRVFDNCPKVGPCCGEDEQSFFLFII